MLMKQLYVLLAKSWRSNTFTGPGQKLVLHPHAMGRDPLEPSSAQCSPPAPRPGLGMDLLQPASTAGCQKW